VVNKRFGGRGASNFRTEFRDEGEVSTALSPTQRGSLYVIWGYISLITKFNRKDGGSTASETLVYNHQTTRRNYPENHDLKITVKVKLSLCLTKHHTIKTYWGVEVYLHIFFTSVLDGG
jgi:hypothetical protein